MACGTVTNIRIEPVNVFFKMQEQWCFDFSGDITAAGLGGKYVLLASPTVEYYAWFDENNTDVDPAPAGKTEIEVDYAASASASAIATAFAAAVNAIVGLKAVVSDTFHVIVTCTAYGDALDFTVGTATGTGAAVVLNQLSEGRDYDLGLLDGDVEVGFEETLFELTAHQTGVTPIADLRQGVSVEITTVLKEVTSDALNELFAKASGGTHTPMSGTELIGVGSSRQGDNTIVQAGKLVLHPVRLSSSDNSEDLCFWRAYPMPESLTFSGENPKLLSVTWKIYKDEDINENVNFWAFGDWTQLEYVD